jgi:prephenate dehydratase
MNGPGARRVGALSCWLVDDAEVPDRPDHVAYFGPQGTFTEQALFTQPDLVTGQLSPLESIADVLAAVDEGRADLGFVPIENAIEGSVNVTIDILAFERDLLVQREVVIPVDLCLMVLPGVALADIETVASYPHALAQSRLFLAEHLPRAVTVAASSTADAARVLAEAGEVRTAAIAPARAAEVYGLEILQHDIEDHPGNATRFVAVARDGIPAATGHDKTSLVVFQRADAPGSLLGILQEFAARAVNLTKLESRPTKKGLGDYCFLIDLDGHVSDEVVADALRSLKAKQAGVKFLGSFPAAGEHGPARRLELDEGWRRADEWISSLRAQQRR